MRQRNKTCQTDRRFVRVFGASVSPCHGHAAGLARILPQPAPIRVQYATQLWNAQCCTRSTQRPYHRNHGKQRTRTNTYIQTHERTNNNTNTLPLYNKKLNKENVYITLVYTCPPHCTPPGAIPNIKTKHYVTPGSQVITQPSTDGAHYRLSSQF